ncbi:MAG: peptidoglycan-binding domain-containing protein [Gemmatimonadales bacterium]
MSEPPEPSDDPPPGPGGPAEHLARPGDHLGRIATAWGLRSSAVLWNDPNNASLRRRRASPHLLAVGDSVYVPELTLQVFDRPTEQRHRFRAELRPLVLRLALQRADGSPNVTPPTAVLLDGKPAGYRGGPPGELTIPIETVTDRCRLTLGADELVVRIGFLQSIDVVAGYRERLTNLGYDAGDGDDPADRQLRSAVEEFQCDQGLKVDGVCGPETRRRLATVYGC